MTGRHICCFVDDYLVTELLMDIRFASRAEVARLRPVPAELGTRVAAEFREMPGLRVTVSQASRLFSLDIGLCRGVLETLVNSGILFVEEGVFQAVGAGRRHA